MLPYNNIQRFTKNQQQELISRKQLEVLLLQQGWLPNDMTKDLGEDIIVQVYDQGSFSGLTFFIQLKSTNSIEKYILKQNQLISYPFEVSDIKHWENSIVPVVLILWDVKKQTGVWGMVSEVVKILNKRANDWSQNRTVNVHFSGDNTISHEGLKTLRYVIAQYFYPIVSRNRQLDLRMQISIPTDSVDGQNFIKEMKDFIERGGEIAIKPEYIAELVPSEWYVRHFGSSVFSKEFPIYVASREAEESNPTRFDIINNDNKLFSLSYVNMKEIRKGTKEILISNQHQNKFPLLIKLLLNNENHSVAIEIKFIRPGTNIQETKNAKDFIIAMSQPHNRLMITKYGEDKPIILEVPNIQAKNDYDEKFIMLIDMVYEIQTLTGVRLALPSLQISDTDVNDILEIYNIITTGQTTIYNQEAKHLLDKALIQLAIDALIKNMAMTYSGETENTGYLLLNTHIDLGFSSWKFVCKPNISLPTLQNILSDMQDDEQAEIEVTILKGTGTFPKWKKELPVDNDNENKDTL